MFRCIKDESFNKVRNTFRATSNGVMAVREFVDDKDTGTAYHMGRKTKTPYMD